MRDAIALIDTLTDSNVQAFLYAIRVGEGTADLDGYRRHFGGKMFVGWDDHPREVITAGLGRNQYSSSAAGAYQFLTKTWDECAAALSLRDFSPRNQDIAAAYLIERRGALDDVIAGRFDLAVRKCAKEWASLPGSPYGQPTKTLAQARATYAAAGGQFNEQPKEKPVAPILAALLPGIIQSIPALGKLFGSGSEVAERNVKAAELAVNIVTDAVGATNAMQAEEMIRSDQELAQKAEAAIQDRWFDLVDSGGGGIDGARKADAVAVAGSGFWRSPSFWIAVALLPLVYMIVAAVVGLIGSPFSDEVRSAIANGVIGMILGSLAGYYFGQTTSRNRT